MNQRTITLPADTLHFAITFADVLDQPQSTQPPVDSADTGEADTGLATTAESVLSSTCNAGDIFDAISDDSRFTQRSLDAIQKYLSYVEPTAVAECVKRMLANNELSGRVRRNGTTVYSAS